MVMQLETVDVLSQFIATRSPELREKLVLQSVPLVHFLLARMGISQSAGSEYEDLAHQGLMGLIEAVDHFNPDFSSQFSTYASLRIRGRILDYLRTSDWMSRTARKRSRMIQKSISTLWAENKREPNDEELAAHLGTTVEQVQRGLEDSNRMLVSLDAMMDGEKSEEGLPYESVRDDNQEDPAEVVERENLIAGMAAAIQYLSKRDKLILSLYYNDELTFREIATVLDLTESRVCQLHARVILHLKEMMNDEQ